MFNNSHSRSKKKKIIFFPWKNCSIFNNSHTIALKSTKPPYKKIYLSFYFSNDKTILYFNNSHNSIGLNISKPPPHCNCTHQWAFPTVPSTQWVALWFRVLNTWPVFWGVHFFGTSWNVSCCICFSCREHHKSNPIFSATRKPYFVKMYGVQAILPLPMHLSMQLWSLSCRFTLTPILWWWQPYIILPWRLLHKFKKI
jgi:hypothetical protein